MRAMSDRTVQAHLANTYEKRNSLKSSNLGKRSFADKARVIVSRGVQTNANIGAFVKGVGEFQWPRRGKQSMGGQYRLID